MATVRATAILNRVSGKPEDASVNVWHFSTIGTPVEADFAVIGNAVAEYYGAISPLIAVNVSTAALAHRVDLATVTMGAAGAADDVVSPIQYVKQFTMASQVHNALPNEVAVCMSFAGDLSGLQEESGLTRPRARRRGRIYLGPIGAGQLTAAAPANEPQIALSCRETVLDAYDNMTTVLAASSPNTRHVIYSRVGASTAIVTSVSVDNEFDTLRSRGKKPSIRMTRT